MAPKILDFPKALEDAGVIVRYLEGWDMPYRSGKYWRPDPRSSTASRNADPHGHMWHHTASGGYTPNRDKANGWAGMGSNDSLRLHQTGNEDSFPVYVFANIYPAKYTSGSGCRYVLEDYVMQDKHFVTRQTKGDDDPKWYGNSYYWNTEVVLDGIGTAMDDRLWDMLITVAAVQNEVMGWSTARHIGHAMHSSRKIDLRDGRYDNMAETILQLRRDVEDFSGYTPPPIEPPPEGEHEMNEVRRGDGYASKGTEYKRPTVKAAQQMLAHWGFADQNTSDGTCASDGIFGPGTEDAVKKFQRANGLADSGIVDAGTWDKLESW
jgi:hypothetical protein